MLKARESETTIKKTSHSFGLAGYLAFSFVVHGGLVWSYLAIAAMHRDSQQAEIELPPIEVVLLESEEIIPLPTPTEPLVTSPAQAQNNQPIQSESSSQKLISPGSKSTSQKSLSSPSQPASSPASTPKSSGRSPSPQPSPTPATPTPAPTPAPQKTSSSNPAPNPRPTPQPAASPPSPSASPTPNPTPAPQSPPAPTPKPPAPAPKPSPAPTPTPTPAPSSINCVQGCGDRRGNLNGQSGVAIVRVEINQSGSVVAANIVSSSGNSSLDSKAIAAARGMKFSSHNAPNNQSRQVRINLGS